MVRVVAIADSDSYLKWSAATLEAMPASWRTEQWLIRNPIAWYRALSLLRSSEPGHRDRAPSSALKRAVSPKSDRPDDHTGYAMTGHTRSSNQEPSGKSQSGTPTPGHRHDHLTLPQPWVPWRP